MISALAFLPECDVAAGMQYLHSCVPDVQDADKLQSLLSYFDATYVKGTARRVQRPAASTADDVTAAVPRIITLRQLPPLFPVATWNVHTATVNGDDRTNNQCEAWNRGFASLVGHNHPSVWCVIEALQQDAAAASITLLQNARGQPPAKRVKRATVLLQQRLHTICVAMQTRRRQVCCVPSRPRCDSSD